MKLSYTDPKLVLSPKSAVSDLEILVDGKEASFSIAKMTWYETPNTYGIRWNGQTEKDGTVSKGAPISTGYPVWFILPSRVVECMDMEKLLKVNNTQDDVVHQIVSSVEKQKKEDPDAFSLSVFYEGVSISEAMIDDIKSILESKSITLISYKVDVDYTTFNVAYT